MTTICRHFLATLLFLACVAPLLAGRKPNVILILADDQGTLDAGCYGAKDLTTPNLDKLAQRGVRFTQFYAASAICSASRAGLLTGKTPMAAGVPGNVGLTSEGLPSSEVTIAECMQEAGYKTAHIGKWHLGNHAGTVPNGQGFDYSFGHHVGCIDNYSHFFYWSGPNKHDLFRNNKEVHYPGRFFPDMMVEEATSFIEKHKTEPFFIYFALNLPHYPYQGDKEWLDHYKDLPHPRNLYAAFLSTMDTRIGRLLGAVEEMELTSNTIVVFQSDHGHSTEERAHFGGGYAGPYRGAKASLFEGGLRVPAIISWPGQLPTNERREQMAVSCDWLPTILDLCGVPQPAHAIDGKSLVDIFKSASASSPHERFNWQLGKQWVAREGNFKLCHDVNDTSDGHNRKTIKGDHLYDLSKDQSETNNLANEHPDVVEHLRKQHDAWKNSWR